MTKVKINSREMKVADDQIREQMERDQLDASCGSLGEINGWVHMWNGNILIINLTFNTNGAKNKYTITLPDSERETITLLDRERGTLLSNVCFYIQTKFSIVLGVHIRNLGSRRLTPKFRM